MLFLLYIFNTICSSGQSAIGKHYTANGGNSVTFNVNKAFSGMIIFLIFGIFSGMSFNLPTLIYGICYGIFLCISMHTGLKALSLGPMALTSIIASFSLIIPFIFGITVLNEKLSFFGVIGIILLLSAIVILNIKKESNYSLKWFIYAIITLIVNGINSLIQKYHQISCPGQYRIEFMIYSLAVTFIILSAFSVPKNKAKKISFCIPGAISGIMNSLSNYIVLYLAGTENASILFPIVSVINVIAVWIIGRVIFKEKLQPMQIVGLILGIISIVLLKFQ